MKTSRLILINSLIFLLIVGAGVGGFYYYYQQSNFVTTDDAQVMGDSIPVAATAAGKLTEWNISDGEVVKEGDIIGKVNVNGKVVDVTAPADGTIVQSNGVNGQLVTAGQPLAQVMNMNELYIIANIEETTIQEISEGQDVDVTIDAQKGVNIKGTVTQIGKTTNAYFSLFPQQNASGNYTKVVQRIPVKITMNDYPNEVIPGLNATVTIHK